MSSSAFLTALRVEQRPIASYDEAAALEEFCVALRAERIASGFGAADGAPRWTAAQLLHPAGPACIAAFLGDTIVGISRLEIRPTANRLGVIVRRPWRRAGIGAKLVRTTTSDASIRELGVASMFVSRSNRAGLALGRACGMERIDHGDRLEFRLRLGNPSLRCA